MDYGRGKRRRNNGQVRALCTAFSELLHVTGAHHDEVIHALSVLLVLSVYCAGPIGCMHRVLSHQLVAACLLHEYASNKRA